MKYKITILCETETELKNTEKYIKYARQYYQLERTNWIQRVLKAPYIKQCEENPLNRQTPEIPLFRMEFLREQRMGEATTKHFNRRKTIQQIPILTDCRFNSSISFSFYSELFDFDMSEEQNNNLVVSLPPYNNCSCFVPYNSSLISSSPILKSNTTENDFFIVHDDIHYPIFSVDYRMDQHERCGLKSFHMISPMDFSCCFLNIRVGPSPFLISDSIYPNIIKLELFNYKEQVLQNCYMLHEKKCEGGCNSFLPITYKVYGDCDSN